jgi:hypothetical protein
LFFHDRRSSPFILCKMDDGIKNRRGLITFRPKVGFGRHVPVVRRGADLL